MMPQFAVIKNGLVAHDDAARTALSKHKLGAVIDIELLNPINTKFNAKMMLAIDKLAKATGVSFKYMRAKLLVLTGRFERIAITADKKITVPHSMSRSAMTMADREQFWDDMRELATQEILPHLSEHEANEIRDIFADRQPASAEATQ